MHFECGDLISFKNEVPTFDIEKNAFGGYNHVSYVQQFKPVICLSFEKLSDRGRVKVVILRDTRVEWVIVRKNDVTLTNNFAACMLTR